MINDFECGFKGTQHLLSRVTELEDPISSLKNSIVKVTMAETMGNDEENDDSPTDQLVSGRGVTKKSSKLNLLDGPGLDLEPMRGPSTTNVATTLFRKKSFRDSLQFN